MHRATTALALAVLVAAACKDDRRNEPNATPAAPPPRATTDLGNKPIRNPRNLYDIWIDGSPDFHTVGTIDDVPVYVEDLEAQSVGVFSRVAEQIYDARDDGYRWLLERAALQRLADAAGQPLLDYAQSEFEKLPAPTEAELAQILQNVELAELSPEEQHRAARSLWRLDRWRSRRAELIARERQNMKFSRFRHQISQPQYASADTVVAMLDEREITRGELRALAGYRAETARYEYWYHAKTQFETYATVFLREREAKHLGVEVDRLVELEIERMPPPTKADVDAFIAENPEYGADARGRERARDNLRRLRQIRADEVLDRRLRSAADVQFLLIEPLIPRRDIEIPAPRRHGPADAPTELVVFHSVGCDTCARGSHLLLTLLKARPGELRAVAGDYFESDRLGSYRGALALRCAPPASRDALLEKLTYDFGTGEIGQLVSKLRALEPGATTEAFERCLDTDAHLPAIVENLEMAERLGLQRNIAGFFAAGVRLGELGDPAAVLGQIDQALHPLAP